MLLMLWSLLACEMVPNHVEVSDIDDALARKHYKTMCVGLKMKEDSVRQYATERLRAINEPDGIEIANDCICEHVKHPDHGWDRAIADGLQGSEDDAKVKCFADLVADSTLPDRLEAVTRLARIPASSARDTLAAIGTTGDSPADQRVKALQAVGAIEKYRDAVIETAGSDAPAEVRAAALTALGKTERGNAVRAALSAAMQDDEGAVRAAALMAMKRLREPKADDLLCEAMLNDPDATVRTGAVRAYQGTKRSSAIACLRKRALTFEEDAGARQAMLDVLKSSPSDDAAQVLCDAIPFWLRSYLKEDLPDKIPGTDIIKVQNDRDWERSYACVQQAYRNSSGYSCYARMYVGYWFNELGGSGFIPKCPKYNQ